MTSSIKIGGIYEFVENEFSKIFDYKNGAAPGGVLSFTSVKKCDDGVSYDPLCDFTNNEVKIGMTITVIDIIQHFVRRVRLSDNEEISELTLVDIIFLYDGNYYLLDEFSFAKAAKLVETT